MTKGHCGYGKAVTVTTGREWHCQGRGHQTVITKHAHPAAGRLLNTPHRKTKAEKEAGKDTVFTASGNNFFLKSS